MGGSYRRVADLQRCATGWRSPNIGRMRPLGWAVDFLFPPRCPACLMRTVRVDLCPACRRAVRFAGSPLCPCCGESFAGTGPDHLCHRCAQRHPRFARARACTLYRSDRPDPIITTLHRFKYGRDVTLAGMLGRFLAAHSPLQIDQDLVVPVPLHPDRLRWRGFNQALSLARRLVPRGDPRLAPMALVRQRATLAQVGLGEADRRSNIRGAFAVRDPARLRGRRVLLVDDVMTTGATADECAGTLRRAGARQVDVLVLARAAA